MDINRFNLLRSIGNDNEIANHELIAEAVQMMEDLFKTPEGEAVLTVNILREFDRKKIERFALHLLGDQAQSLLQYVECGCGDIRYRGDMCHLCDHCQTGCCMCAETISDLEKDNKRLFDLKITKHS